MPIEITPHIAISDDELEWKFIRASGPGGQNVNKVSTCVVLRHIPTGLEVRCQRERSQGVNRFLARRLLVEKIETLRRGTESAKQKEFEKIRRQKRKRSKRAKDKMLDSKRHRAEKKNLRRAPADF